MLDDEPTKQPTPNPEPQTPRLPEDRIEKGEVPDLPTR
jgi:hypothetical protein